MARPRIVPSPEIMALLRQMQSDRRSVHAMHRATGISRDKISSLLEPGYRERRNEQKRLAGYDRRSRIAETASGGVAAYLGRPSPEEAYARLAAIPTDTRDLTARICGDPLPGRRAIDMRGQE